MASPTKEQRAEAKSVDGLEKIKPIVIEAADEGRMSSEYFNYHATLDPDNGFVTIKFNFIGMMAIPPVFNVVIKELRKIMIARNEAMDTEAEYMAPDPMKGGPGFLCVAFYEFTGGLIVGSRAHILGKIVPEKIYELIHEAAQKA